jgi:hypothetical protein
MQLLIPFSIKRLRKVFATDTAVFSSVKCGKLLVYSVGFLSAMPVKVTRL